MTLDAPHDSAEERSRAREVLSQLVSGPIINRSELALLGFIAAVCLGMTIWHPDDFATWSNVQNMARQGAVLGVVAIGQMFVPACPAALNRRPNEERRAQSSGPAALVQRLSLILAGNARVTSSVAIVVIAVPVTRRTPA